MPSRDADGFGAVQFRNRHETAAARSAPGLFGLGVTIFLAVLLALIVMEILTSIRDAYVTRQAIVEFNAQMAELEREAQRPRPQVFQESAVTLRQAQRTPRYVGPTEANATGSDTACMGGRTAVRIPNGWRGTNQRCIATTP